MSDVLTINSATINMVTSNTALDRCVLYRKGGIPELHFSRLVGKLAALPDTWSGKPVTLTMTGSNTLVFSGDIVGYVDSYHDDVGWYREYRALGLRNRADYVPVTDSNTLTDTAMFNLPGTDPNFIGSRAGQTVGQIVTAVLQMTPNASALTAYGIGNYTMSMGAYTLPSVTTTDLSALSVIPQSRVAISGERILQVLESFVQSYHPNHYLWVDPSGNIRFLDMRNASTYYNNTLTMGGDPRVGMPQLTRDYSECYSQVVVRGNTLANICTLQTSPWPGSANSDGGLQEDFAWGSYTTNAAAIAAWVPSNWNQPSISGGNPNDVGTCTCPSTTTVTVTSSNTSQTWAANFWGQGANEALGVVYLYADVITGVQQLFQARVVSCTALSAGGTSTLTLDRTLPALTYNAYALWGIAENANLVWRRYKVSNSSIAAAMLNLFPYPVAIASAPGNAASLTSSPQGYVWWSSSGSAPFNISTLGITLDPTNGLIYFDRPTALVYGGGATTPPTNVSVVIPIANGSLSVTAPFGGGYSGTLYTVEGVSRAKTITVRDWTDYGNTSTMQTYANETLASLRDVVVEGSVPYYGLNATFLLAGQAISIAGTTGSTAYTTGWESLALPVVSAEIQFNSGQSGATSYTMSLGLSNRRGRYTAENFLRPAVTGAQLGFDGYPNLGGAGASLGASLSTIPGGVGGYDISMATPGESTTPNPTQATPGETVGTGMTGFTPLGPNTDGGLS